MADDLAALTASLDRMEARGPIERATDNPGARRDLRWAMLTFAADALDWVYSGIESSWSVAEVKEHLAKHARTYERRAELEKQLPRGQ